MSDIQDAEEAICGAVVKRIEHDHAAAGGDGVCGYDGVKTMADAVAALKWGPDGGNSRQETDYRGRTETKYDGRTQTSSDEHYTRHDGEERERPTGFAP